ncbi:DUF6415 family natural product biosynthesis protein [Streptomyces sp. NPDC051104]|uniref:DUF6415 family natural product biosynthesis protein n=1 Tax=Streptomyces sp. NPDC051104 TaxID=3155044 RepID=UPI00341F7602
MTYRLLDPPSEAVAEWLSSAALQDAETARREWESDGMTVLQCGSLFTAIRVPLDVVEAAAGEFTLPNELDAYLADALLGAPVIRCTHGRRLYVLCDPSTVKDWRVPGTECLGKGYELGVPRPDLIGYPGRTSSYWAVPISQPGNLGSGAAVSQLVLHGRFAVAREFPNPDHEPPRKTAVDLDGMRKAQEEILDLTRGMPGLVPPRAKLEPAVAELQVYVEDLVREVEAGTETEEDSAGQETTKWLIGRIRKNLAAELPPGDREAALQAEDLALCCRTLTAVYLRQQGASDRGASGD